MGTLLLVEDDALLQEVLSKKIKESGYSLVCASSLNEAILLAKQYLPSAVVLDLTLGKESGFDFLKSFRAWSENPVIILSAIGEEDVKITALEKGANDYLTKPFSYPELLARLKVWMKHFEKNNQIEKKIESKNLTIDFETKTVLKNGEPVLLSHLEHSLLFYLAKNRGKLLTSSEILKTIWGPLHEKDTHYLRIYIAQLRKKIENVPSQPKLILNEPGIGYRFCIEVERFS